MNVVKKQQVFQGMLVLLFFICSNTQAKTLKKNSTKQAEPEISRSINRFQPWRPVQEMIKDTVVQVFSQIAEFNWLQPYSTPGQFAVRGSGFIISAEGFIITNAHVVDQAVAVWIQVPSLGKKLIKVEVIGICPEKDLALLCIIEQDLSIIKKELGAVPFLHLGDSDTIRRADEAMALGYPLGQQSLKSTTGIISGREQHLIQTSTPINPGSSGGPLLNTKGQVIGVNCSGIVEAQNVGYAIPINDLKIVLPDLYTNKIVRKPFLGILSVKATESLTSYLNNPQPGGCYVVEVIKNSPLEKAGVLAGDMIYEINGYRLDIYGELSVPWSEDKVSVTDYIGRLASDQEVTLVVYRDGERKEFILQINHTQTSPIHKMYPWHEKCDFEIYAGMVVMPLTINHIQLFGDQIPGLRRYTIPNSQTEEVLLITHIFPNSELAYSRTISTGFTINEVNGIPVKTLDDFRDAIKLSTETGFFVLTTADQVSCASDNIPTVLPFETVLKETIELSEMYRYQLSDAVQELALEVFGN